MLITYEEIKPRGAATIIYNQNIICVIQNIRHTFNARLNVQHDKDMEIAGYAVKENNPAKIAS